MSDTALEQLLAAAYGQTLARFEDEVARGVRDPAKELESYRKQRRDYVSLLRIEMIPDEARELAGHLLQTHGLSIDDASRRDFEHDTAEMLIRLYDAFIARAEASQGSR